MSPLLHLSSSPRRLQLPFSLSLPQIPCKLKMSMQYRTQTEAAMAAATINSSSSVDNDDYSHAIIKGKRAKRRRLRNYLPVPVPAAATPSTSSSSSAAAASDSIDEEEDMANCLILLAQGRALKEAGLKPEARIEGDSSGTGGRSERYTSRRLAETVTMTNGKVNFYVYECKTCNKCFPSFQALGGHRSSHKKIKMATLMAAGQEKKPSEVHPLGGLHLRISTSYNSHPNLLPNATTPRNNNVNNSGGNNKINDIMINTSSIRQKVHECSICGAEFSSGQALGGHMRRHRAEPISQGSGVPQVQEAKEKGVVLPDLDLNLPAPADDVDHGGDHLSGSPSFGFPPKKPLIFSPSSMVDCHY